MGVVHKQVSSETQYQKRHTREFADTRKTTASQVTIAHNAKNTVSGGDV